MAWQIYIALLNRFSPKWHKKSFFKNELICALKILDSELKNKELDLSNRADPAIFKNDYEKNLYKKVHELRKYESG